MTYKYYSIMRPIGIGTTPRDKNPVRIYNYPEGRTEIIAEDGRKLMAWGEIEYAEPLTQDEMRRYELKGEYEYSPYKHVGFWRNNPNDVEIVMIDGQFFALSGWNGLDYSHCWKCKSKFEVADNKEYCLKPIHGYDTPAGIAMMNEMNDLDEDSEEWQKNSDYLTSIVSYEVW